MNQYIELFLIWSRMSETYFLISDPRSVARLPGERDARRSDLHWARQAQDCHCHRRCIRPKKTRENPLWVWYINIPMKHFFVSLWVHICGILLLIFNWPLYFMEQATWVFSFNYLFCLSATFVKLLLMWVISKLVNKT